MEYGTGGHHVDLRHCPGDSRVQKAMNALSGSITAVFSCVTDRISLILLNCFGISCVNEHNGTEKKKKRKAYTNCEQGLQLFLWALVYFWRSKRACLAVTFGLGYTFWICHAQNPMWNFPCVSTGDRPWAANTYHFKCSCFHTDTMTLKKIPGPCRINQG